jgi:hypothetical protein
LLVEGTIPIQHVEKGTAGTDRREAVRRFKEEHPLARVESIDGVFVRGFCIVCELPVLEDDRGYKYYSDSETYVCPGCTTQGKKPKRKAKTP